MDDGPVSVMEVVVVDALAALANRLHRQLPPSIADKLTESWFESALSEIRYAQYRSDDDGKGDEEGTPVLEEGQQQEVSALRGDDEEVRLEDEVS